jgi:hypothetical protein
MFSFARGTGLITCATFLLAPVFALGATGPSGLDRGNSMIDACAKGSAETGTSGKVIRGGGDAYDTLVKIQGEKITVTCRPKQGQEAIVDICYPWKRECSRFLKMSHQGRMALSIADATANTATQTELDPGIPFYSSRPQDVYVEMTKAAAIEDGQQFPPALAPGADYAKFFNVMVDSVVTQRNTDRSYLSEYIQEAIDETNAPPKNSLRINTPAPVDPMGPYPSAYFLTPFPKVVGDYETICQQTRCDAQGNPLDPFFQKTAIEPLETFNYRWDLAERGALSAPPTFTDRWDAMLRAQRSTGRPFALPDLGQVTTPLPPNLAPPGSLGQQIQGIMNRLLNGWRNF